jgi:hypothetical protein
VNTKTKSARRATLFLVAGNKTRTPNATPDADFSAVLQDLCSLEVHQAIEIEKTSLATFVGLNSCVIEFYKNAFWFAPAFGDLLDAADKSFACCMELQMSWLTMIAPQANKGPESSLPVAAPVSVVASHGSHPAEEEEYSMDIAIGARLSAPRSRVATNSDKKSQYKHRARAKAA